MKQTTARAIFRWVAGDQVRRLMVFKVRNFQRILSAAIKCVGESLFKTPKEPASVVESDGKSH